MGARVALEVIMEIANGVLIAYLYGCVDTLGHRTN